VKLISLQKNHGTEQLANLPEGMAVEILGEDLDSGPDAFLDTAAVMMNLDLIITSDTAIAHLAGALARPLWIALKKVPDWRWVPGGKNSPWYPTARLFRQSRFDGWEDVFAEMAGELAQLVAQRSSDEANGSREACPRVRAGGTAVGEIPDAEPRIALASASGGKLQAGYDSHEGSAADNAPHPAPAQAPGVHDNGEVVLIPVSFGELIDKITILKIKAQRIADAAKLANVRNELERLAAVRARLSAAGRDVDEFEAELMRTNETLWDVEDRIRDCEREKNFGPEFIELARSVYRTNDRRADIKRQLNTLAGSSIVEEKSYARYESDDIAGADPGSAGGTQDASLGLPAPIGAANSGEAAEATAKAVVDQNAPPPIESEQGTRTTSKPGPADCGEAVGETANVIDQDAPRPDLCVPGRSDAILPTALSGGAEAPPPPGEASWEAGKAPWEMEAPWAADGASSDASEPSRADRKVSRLNVKTAHGQADIAAQFKRGLTLHQAGRLAEAEQAYHAILRVQPRHFNSLHLLGVICAHNGNHAEAVRQIDLALEVNPSVAAAHNNRGGALRELKRFEEALASYDRAIALKPNFTEALYNRGLALTELKRFDEALVSYDRAIALRPDYADAFNNRGVALQELKRFSQAVASYDRAIELRPDYAEAVNNRSGAREELKLFGDALARPPHVASEAHRIEHDPPPALAHAGQDRRVLCQLADAPSHGEGKMKVTLWAASPYFGWGVFGLNLALEWSLDCSIAACTAADINLDGIDALRRRALEPFIERSSRARGMGGEGLILHALGNEFMPDADGGVAVIFFETPLSPEALSRAKRYDLIITGSTWNEDVLRGHGVTNVTTVLQGIDPTLFHPAPRRGLFSDRFVIFSGGKAEPRKGQDLVVSAFRIFAKRHPEALLVTAWHSPWPEFAAGMDLDLSALADQVIDVGQVPNAQMPAILRECDVALFPNRAEGGTNLVAMEAIACGVHTIVSANTGHFDLVKRGVSALRVQKPSSLCIGGMDSDVEEMLEKLELAFTSPPRPAANPIEDLTWSRTAEQLKAAIMPFAQEAGHELRNVA
jgi:tetratricopeptide (TPR) repeat protein